MEPHYSVLCNYVIFHTMFSIITAGSGVGGQLFGKEHRTQAASEKIKELWCYHCNSMDGGERCIDLINATIDLHLKCKDEKICMAKRISLTTSTGNSTSAPRLWLLERNCTKHCEPGCIMIGERTKLHACTTCCEGDFCNIGSGAQSPYFINHYHFVQLICIVFTLMLTYLIF